MPKYESNQALMGFMRRLPAYFSGFTAQMVPLPEGTTQMFFGEMNYRDNKLSIAMFTRPSDKRDCVVVSRPLFYIPDSAAAEIFQQLLYFNNGATETVHFAIDEPLNTINLVCFRSVEGLTFPEFKYCVDNMIDVAANCANRMVPEFGLMRTP